MSSNGNGVKRGAPIEIEPRKLNPKRVKPLSELCRRQGAMDTIRALCRVVAKRKHGPPGAHSALRCVSCGSATGRLHACVESKVVVCRERGHLAQYLDTTGYDLAIDLDTGGFYSHGLKDYVYHSAVERALAVELCLQLAASRGVNQLRAEELPALLDHSAASKPGREHGLWGLRGMNNLGNTCFMGCILQALSNNPLLERFVLSPQLQPQHVGLQLSPEAPGTLGLHILDAIAQLHDGSPAAFSPHAMLLSLWRSVESLKGYSQQDAHEFFIAAVNALHRPAAQGGAPEGHNLAQTVFGGLMRSTVSCSECHRSSARSEPFHDISLDLAGHEEVPVAVQQCMEVFTQPEHLLRDEQTFCPNCDAKTDCTKQLLIESPPSVLAVHFKRFKRSLAATTKLDRQVLFECDGMDMAPFCLDRKEPLLYDLFATVEHKGSMDTGHYLAYIRKHGEWFKCDDAWISRVSQQEVQRSQGYMLFYVQRGFCMTELDQMNTPSPRPHEPSS